MTEEDDDRDSAKTLSAAEIEAWPRLVGGRTNRLRVYWRQYVGDVTAWERRRADGLSLGVYEHRLWEYDDVKLDATGFAGMGEWGERLARFIGPGGRHVAGGGGGRRWVGDGASVWFVDDYVYNAALGIGFESYDGLVPCVPDGARPMALSDAIAFVPESGATLVRFCLAVMSHRTIGPMWELGATTALVAGREDVVVFPGVGMAMPIDYEPDRPKPPPPTPEEKAAEIAEQFVGSLMPDDWFRRVLDSDEVEAWLRDFDPRKRFRASIIRKVAEEMELGADEAERLCELGGVFSAEASAQGEDTAR